MLTTNSRIYDLLAATGLFDENHLQRLLKEARENGMPICKAVLEGSEVKEDQLLEKLAEAMKLPYQRLKEVEIEEGALEKLPTKAIFQYNVIPLSDEDNCLKVATSDPFISGLVDALRLAAGCRIRLPRKRLRSERRRSRDSRRKHFGSRRSLRLRQDHATQPDRGNRRARPRPHRSWRGQRLEPV
jgi:hypothetical protein